MKSNACTSGNRIRHLDGACVCTRGHTAGLLAAELCLAATQSCLPRMNPLRHTMRTLPYLERAVIHSSTMRRR